MRSGNHVLDGSPDPPWKGAILRGKGSPIEVLTAVSCANTFGLPFGLWTWVGRRKHEFTRIRQVAPMCTSSIVFARAHWRHLANMTESSIYCGDAALCQIILTTCLA